MIWVLVFYNSAFILLQIAYDIMLDDAPKSTKQLCAFILKFSKDNKKGGVMDFDYLLIMALFKVVGILLKDAIILDDLLLLREMTF